MYQLHNFINNAYYSCFCLKKFFKIKIDKFYLRSTMSQERLSELAILSIEKKILEKIE